ncbi:MAG: HAMP domain-containing sensor histidine kinase [Pseudomonadota bacterium]
MSKLHIRIYFYLMAVSLGSILVVGGAVRIITIRTIHDLNCTGLAAYGRLTAGEFPGPDGSAGEYEKVFERHRPSGLFFSVYGPDKKLIASSHGTLPNTTVYSFKNAGCFVGERSKDMAAVPMEDGRLLMVEAADTDVPQIPFKLFIASLVMAVAATIGCYPISRHITRRLETLRKGVEKLEAGDLSTRVEVKGRDEVAVLTASFNRAAKWIERLVKSQKRILASSSHELRSPLARIRVSSEMIKDLSGQSGGSPESEAKLREKVRELALNAIEDVEELEKLVDDILLATRLETMDEPETVEPVDVFELLKREAKRSGARVDGSSVTIVVSPAMVARLIRNLLENAGRYGEGPEVEASLDPLGGGDDGVVIRIADRGPGVPEDDRERIFEPFYRLPAHRKLKGKGKGVGLGLALVRQIAAFHSGEVKYVAREGGGSIFEVTLRSTGSGKNDSPH